MATYETLRSERREDARKKLDSYRSLCTLNEQMLKLMADADSRMLSVTAQMGETRGSSTARDALGDNLAAIFDVKEQMSELCAGYSTSLDAIAKIVREVMDIDALAGEVLAIRYMEPGRPTEFCEIADRLGYTEAHIYGKHLDGLDIAADVMNILSIPK